VELRIPFTTLLKIAFTILLIACVIKLWPVILMLVIAVLLAVMLDPVVARLEEHRARKGMAIALIAVVMFGVLLAFLIFIIPTTTRQMMQLNKQLPQLIQRFPAAAPLLKPEATSQPLVSKGLSVGMYAVQGLTAVVFVMVVSIYLLVEGRRAYVWLASLAPAQQRTKLDRTMREMNPVILAFMRGQFITSGICALYVFGVMSALRVPMPLLLATIAFVADFVPVIGTIVMTAPAAALALAVSPARSLVVVLAYLVYHLIENYVIIPRVYGTQMRLSTLTVLVAISIGGTLQGVIGAVLALPLAAAYPIVERIWLRDKLPEDTVPRHDAIENAAEGSPR
jgi:predicted PurR-regulated permease PerM